MFKSKADKITTIKVNQKILTNENVMLTKHNF